ncbi:MFS transporter [Parvibaculum sp.]|jgi:MFS family permease|uniref:MFS transporter n=1 Tax=Parvibaculum sp. TaxID=2024848 RepID=UPI000C8F274D|nr:MFS transporter [Parvibaculum sp.]MAB15541.1 MFS transporter [Parvibaculum sp.]
MIDILGNRTYRHLFFAQIVALVGTGLATVALGLLAYELAGQDAGAVLGTALAIKMVAYVLVAPLAGAYANRLPRRALLVALDVARLTVVLLLPWVNQVWQIYVLIFVLQSCSAAFTPSFQATIPEVLPEEDDYTKALSLSRLAYDLENLLSPALAAALLAVVTYHELFLGTAVGFLGSALLVVSVALPQAPAEPLKTSVRRKLTSGARIYLATPRLRGLLALTLAAAAGSAMVIVNTVVIVRSGLARPESAVAIALAAFGAGSMLMAFVLPKLLERRSDRSVMLVSGAVLTLGLVGLALIWSALAVAARWPAMLVDWFVLGMAYSALVTPSGRLLRRSSHEVDRPALYAAQFSLSHACWLLAYPLVGWLGARAGIPSALWVMAGLAAVGVTAALWLWPKDDNERLHHTHDALPADHPHLLEYGPEGQHAHTFVIDDLHTRWPTR